MKWILILLMLTLTFEPSFTQVPMQPANLKLMPMPLSVKKGAGRLLIDPSFSIGISGHVDSLLQRAVRRFLEDLRRQTGMLPMDMRVTDAKAILVVHADHAA